MRELAKRMTKIVLGFKSKSKSGSRGKTSVTEKRVRNTDGQVKTLRTLDAGSTTFGSDLQYVFSRNVAKARRDNKRATGAPDGVVKR
jgi:hypothetical protein